MAVNECCKDEKNLVLMKSDRPDIKVRICRVCGRKHTEVTVDVGNLGVKVV